MKVNDWFNNGCDYWEGVSIYIALKQSKPNLIRIFKLKQTAYNTEKLKSELKKYKEVLLKETKYVQTTSEKVNSPVDNSFISEITAELKPIQPYKPSLINEYPVELHPTYIKQKSDFTTACSLKIQLNSLAPDAEFEALKLCLEIETLFDAVEQAWKILDHYSETKTILEIKETNFIDLSPARLLQRRNQLRSTISKTKSKINTYKTAFEKATTIALKTKLTVQMQRAKEKQLQLEDAVEKLTALINK